MSTAGQPNPARKLNLNEEKWTPELWRGGWTAIPSVIFEYQTRLGLDPLDINIILHLVSHWWKKDNKPYPFKVTIANRIGVDPRTVQRRIAAMERAKFIRREY